MASRKKTWQEKLTDKSDLPKFLKLEKRFPCFNAVHKMGAEVGDDIVLVNPSGVIEFMKKVPHGKLTTIVEICKGGWGYVGHQTPGAGVGVVRAGVDRPGKRAGNRSGKAPIYPDMDFVYIDG